MIEGIRWDRTPGLQPEWCTLPCRRIEHGIGARKLTWTWWQHGQEPHVDALPLQQRAPAGGRELTASAQDQRHSRCRRSQKRNLCLITQAISGWGQPRRGPVRARLSGNNLWKAAGRASTVCCTRGLFHSLLHRAVRPNGKPRAAFSLRDCARNCIECDPLSSPRYTLAHRVIPLTSGPFDSKIHTVRLERFERAAAPSALRFKGWSVSLLIIVLPLSFPPRSEPDLGRPAESKDSRNLTRLLLSASGLE